MADHDEHPIVWREQRTFAAHLVRAVARVLLVILTLRVVLFLFAPQPDDQRVAWFIADTQPLIDPFRVVMHTVFIDPWNGTILDTLSITAIIGYAILEALLVRAIWWQHIRPEPLPPLPAKLLTTPRPPDRPRRRLLPRRPSTPDPVPTTPVKSDVHLGRD